MSADQWPVRVLKFGGSTFVELADYRRVAGHLREIVAAERTRVVAVVSAMSGTTGRLLDAALAVDPDLDPEVRDEILATGEMVGAGLLRAALHAEGVVAIDLCAPQLGIRSDGTATRARVEAVDPAPLARALAGHDVVVVAGGQAVRADGRVTMLGRNSSDLTAVVLAAALGTGSCAIYSDVAGVHTADPYVVPGAPMLDAVAYAQAMAMAASGAKVLHAGCVAAARDRGVAIACRALDRGSSRPPVARHGTVVGRRPGRTAVVGDRRGELLRPARGRVEPAVRALASSGFASFAVDVDGLPVVVVTGSQPGAAAALAAAGIGATPVEGVGVVSVVAPDGTARRRAVPLADVDDVVRDLHARLYGVCAANVAVRVAKPRSAHSGVLVGGR